MNSVGKLSQHMIMDSRDFLVSVLKNMLKCEDGEVASIIFYTKAAKYDTMCVQDLLTQPHCSVYLTICGSSS
jgi:hypothetical protein